MQTWLLLIGETILRTGALSFFLFTLCCILRRNFSAKCSNGDYLGQFARADKPPGEPLSALLIQNSTGFHSMNGATSKFLEALGEAPDSSSNNSKFHDDCPDGKMFIGYQLTYSSGSGILQIRFLCSDPSTSSACGMLDFSTFCLQAPIRIPDFCSGVQPCMCNNLMFRL